MGLHSAQLGLHQMIRNDAGIALVGSGGASLASGLAGLAEQIRLNAVVPIAVMTLWVVGSLTAATALFYRREV